MQESPGRDGTAVAIISDMRSKLLVLLSFAGALQLTGCLQPTDSGSSQQPETQLDGFTPLSVGSFWIFETGSRQANGHNGRSGSSFGTRTIEILSESVFPEKKVYHAALGDTIQIISGISGLPPDTVYKKTRYPFDITEQGDQLTVAGEEFDGMTMLRRIFRSHRFPESRISMSNPGTDPAFPGVDSVLVADDSGMDRDKFAYWVTQARGIGPILYGGEVGYPGGLITGRFDYRLKAFRIGN